MRVKGLNPADNFSRSVKAPDHMVAVGALMDWIEECSGRDALTAVGHRVVHGGPKYGDPQLITKELVWYLARTEKMSTKHYVANAGVITAAASRVVVRVIHTDEELMIAKTVCRVLGLDTASEGRNSDHAAKDIQ